MYGYTFLFNKNNALLQSSGDNRIDIALVLKLVDRHDSGSCVRKDVGVQFSPRAITINGKTMKTRFLKRLSLILVLLLVLASCERNSRPYANTEPLKDGPQYSVKPGEANTPPSK